MFGLSGSLKFKGKNKVKMTRNKAELQHRDAMTERRNTWSSSRGNVCTVDEVVTDELKNTKRQHGLIALHRET